MCGRYPSSSLLGAGVLGDGLGSLRDGVLGQLSGQEEPDSGLDLPGGDGGPLVVVGETRGLGGDSLKDVIHERVHDGHGLGRDTGVGVDLLQDLVDVNGVRFLPPRQEISCKWKIETNQSTRTWASSSSCHS